MTSHTLERLPDGTTLYRTVLIPEGSDPRITLIIDELADHERAALVEACADQGTLLLRWEQPPIPARLERGRAIDVVGPNGPEDSWTIDESTAIYATANRGDLAKLPYAEYLLTAHWRSCRERAFSHYGHACLLCGCTDRLQVHHRTYAHLGAEHLEDLTVLCDDCHAKHHGKVA